jgi:hypothetical protein
VLAVNKVLIHKKRKKEKEKEKKELMSLYICTTCIAV